MNRAILEDLVYFEKTSEELYYIMRKEYSEMSFWKLKSEVVVKVKDYMVSGNFAVVAEILFDKYRDISASSTLNPSIKTCFLNIFCGVAYNMCKCATQRFRTSLGVEISVQSESTTENNSVKEKQQERNSKTEETGQNDRVYEKKKGRLRGNSVVVIK